MEGVTCVGIGRIHGVKTQTSVVGCVLHAVPSINTFQFIHSFIRSHKNATNRTLAGHGGRWSVADCL